MSMLVPFFPFSSSLYAPTRNEGDNDLFPHETYDSLLSPWFDSNVATLPKMKCDVKETDDAYEVKADIPGVDKNDLDVTYDDEHVLTISYEHDDANDKKDDDGKYAVQERSYSTMSRKFVLPKGDKDDVHAKYADGVLIITVAKEKVDDADGNESKVTIE